MDLRPYQQEAVEAVYRHLRERDDNPCVVIPTGGGKTPILATVCRDAVGRWEGRVLILAHVKELLEQAANRLCQVAPDIREKTGVYSAGLKSRDTGHPVIVAGIQSVYRRADELGAFNLIIVDEAHMIPPDGDGMYRSFLEDARRINPNLRVIGLTATPFRMGSGMICAPENVLNQVCYEIGVRELIVQGYLSLLITKASREKIDTSGLRIRAGEFVPGDVEDLIDTDASVKAICGEIVEQTRTRRSVLVFAAGVRHGRHIAEMMNRKHGIEVGTVFGDTFNFERDRLLTDFKAGKLKYLVNVDVLTTGFDAPNIDCVAMIRPTLSPGLYYQMVGRGFRTFEGKENCLVLDFGGNVLRHGPVDAIRIEERNGRRGGESPAKECPSCRSLIAAGYSACPDCGHWFPRPKRGMCCHLTATNMGILSGHIETTEHEVQAVYYAVHIKHDKPNTAPRSMRVTYRLGLRLYQPEWICFEHTGPVRKKAEAWWRRRSNAPVPESAAEAVELAKAGALCQTRAIAVRRDVYKDYDRIVGYALGEKLPWREPGWDEDGIEQVNPTYACANQGKSAP